MTDTWSDDNDFFSMTDEAWWAYQRRMLRGPDVTDAGNAVQKPQERMKGLNPVSPPLVDRAPGSIGLPAELEEQDWAPSCEMKGCAINATYFTSWHPVNRCTHPSLGGELVLHRFVCEGHLAHLEKLSERIVRHLNPPAWVGWFRDDNNLCAGCGKPVQLPTDVLTYTRAI